MFAGLLTEIRAYGEGLIIAGQIPAKLVPDAIKNTAVTIVHRLPAADDRAATGATMNLTEAQSACLVTLPPGQAAVFTDEMDYPLLTPMPDGTGRETTQPAPAASPAPLITARSPACGPDCRAVACTLRQISAAQRAATLGPRITLRAELSVLSHLTGWTMPMPGTVFAAALVAVEPRLRDCALSHAAARIPVIAARASGPALAAHLTAAMRTALDEDRWLCDQQEPQWLAPPYRWALVLDSPRALERREPGTGPHPRPHHRTGLGAALHRAADRLPGLPLAPGTAAYRTEDGLAWTTIRPLHPNGENTKRPSRSPHIRPPTADGPQRPPSARNTQKRPRPRPPCRPPRDRRIPLGRHLAPSRRQKGPRPARRRARLDALRGTRHRRSTGAPAR